MNAIPGHVLGIFCCSGIFLVGRYYVSRPERIARVFAWGQPPTRFGIAFFRVVGWYFCVMAVIGVIFYSAATGVAIFTR